MTIEKVILKRGSTRRFRHDAIRQEQLQTILRAGMQPVKTDFGWGWNELYLIVNAVEGLAAGAYYCGRELELLKAGDLRRVASYLGLSQGLPGDAAAAVFFLTDLEKVTARFGNRGYRRSNWKPA